jgi:hypothetical protein
MWNQTTARDLERGHGHRHRVLVLLASMDTDLSGS